MQTSGEVSPWGLILAWAELENPTKASCRLGAELGLEDRHGAVDEAHPHARHDSCEDDLDARVRRRLQHGSQRHDDGAGGDGHLPAYPLAHQGGGHAAEETSHLVDGDDQAGDGGTGRVEGVGEGFGVDEPCLQSGLVRSVGGEGRGGDWNAGAGRPIRLGFWVAQA